MQKTKRQATFRSINFSGCKGTIKLVRLIIATVLTSVLILGAGGMTWAKPDDAAEVRVLISFREQPGSVEHAMIQNNSGKVRRSYHFVRALAASVPKSRLESLRRNPRVVSVEEDVIVQAIQTLPWGLDRIDAEIVHSQNNKGRGVRIATLDTGIDLDHPDLRVAGDVSFVDGTVSGDDDHGHGTMVAGIIGALDNEIGVVGVAPESELYAVKVLNKDGWGYSSDILSGIEWAIDQDMQVVNISFGSFLGLPEAIRTALSMAYEAGIVIVAGAGNAGDSDFIYSPACYESVIAVGATDQRDERASFSCTGSALELMAPGVGIPSTSPGGGYSSGDGTSFATPHVAAVAALLIASGVTSNVEVRQILQATVSDLGPLGWDKWYGYGLVNAAQAVEMGKNSRPADTILPVTGIELSGSQGNGGWYRSDVEVQLLAVDNSGGSGVAETQYSLDRGETWQSYQGPFIIAREGVTALQAKSQDNAGNAEAPSGYSEVKIDKTAPSANISVAPGLIIPASNKKAMADVMVDGSISDGDGLSGLDSFQIEVKDEYGDIEPSIGAYRQYGDDKPAEWHLQGEIQLGAWKDGNDLDGRVYIISIVATDYAGNSARAETTVTVVHEGKDVKDKGDKGKDIKGKDDKDKDGKDGKEEKRK